jgi:hypothetical protein
MSAEQVFTAIMQGSKVTHYQIKVYDRTGVVGGTLYDTTKTALGSDLYNGDTLSVTIPAGSGTIGSNRELKWVLSVWNDSDTVDSRETPFDNYSAPTVSLSISSPITTQSYEFVGTYSQAQSIACERFKFTLYDSTGTTTLSSSNWIYSGSVRYTFEGLVDDTSYKILCEVYDLNAVYASSGVQTFSVDYTEPSVVFTPSVTNSEDDSSILIEWSGAYSLVGNSTGTFSYVTSGSNKSVYIQSASTIYWTGVNILAESTTTFMWRPQSNSFSGNIIKLEKASDPTKYYLFGYDGSKFTYDVNGETGSFTGITPISTNIYIIGLLPNKIIVNEYNYAYTWNNYLTDTWNDLKSITWNDVLIVA